MSHVFNMAAKSFLEQELGASGTSMVIRRADYAKFVGSHPAGDHFYVVLRNAQNVKEIVKVNVTGSSVGGIAIERGQQGTSARMWPAGTLVYQDITAADLGDLIQKAVFRTIDYNPNGVLVAAYLGEKVYQSDLLLWWKSVAASGTEWRLIAGEIATATPSMSPEAGTYLNGQSVTLSCATSGASIYYTIDGSDPDEDSALYEGAISLPDSSTTTVKAIARGPGRWYSLSEISEVEYITTINIVATPVLSPGDGYYGNGQTISMSCETDGASIYYTVDGSEPTPGSAVYSAPVTLPPSALTTIRAIGHHPGIEYADSDIADGVYSTASRLGVVVTQESEEVYSARFTSLGGGFYAYIKLNYTLGTSKIAVDYFNGAIFSNVFESHAAKDSGFWGMSLTGFSATCFDGTYLHVIASGWPQMTGTRYKILTFSWNGSDTLTLVNTYDPDWIPSPGQLNDVNMFQRLCSDGTYLYTNNGRYDISETEYTAHVLKLQFTHTPPATYSMTLIDSVEIPVLGATGYFGPSMSIEDNYLISCFGESGVVIVDTDTMAILDTLSADRMGAIKVGDSIFSVSEADGKIYVNSFSTLEQVASYAHSTYTVYGGAAKDELTGIYYYNVGNGIFSAVLDGSSLTTENIYPVSQPETTEVYFDADSGYLFFHVYPNKYCMVDLSYEPLP